MNGQPKMRLETGEAMFDSLSSADRTRFEQEEFASIAADLEKLPQEDRRASIRAYILAATEAMTEAHNLGVLATTSQEAERYHEKRDRLNSFYEQLMRLNRNNDE